MIALYSRVSTSEQAREGYSIGEQEERLAAFCRSRGWSKFKHFTDAGYSGGNMNRPALQDMLAGIEKGTITRVIVYKLDRLSRSQKDTIELLEDVFLPHGVDFISVCENFDTGSAFGKAMIGMFSVFAQLEREQIKERSAVGREARAKDGKWHGGSCPPIGYDYVDGFLKVNQFEAMLVRDIFKMYLSGYTVTEIKNELNARGTFHKYGRWNGTTIKKILTSPTYTGKVPYHGQWFDGRHKAIIDEKTLSAAVALSEKTHRYREADIHDAHIMGVLYCARCGEKYMRISTHTGRKPESRRRVSYCFCSSKRKGHFCGNQNYRLDHLEKAVFDEMRLLTLADVKAYRREEKRNTNAAQLEKELAKLSKQRSRLIDLYSLGSFDADELSAKIASIDDARAKIEKQLAADALRPIDELAPVIRSIGDVIDSNDHISIRALVDTLIRRIEIDGDDVNIYWNFD